MRFLNSLLAVVCCFALVLHSHAAGIPAKQTYGLTEYRAAAPGMADEGLNDYFHSTPLSIRITAVKSNLHEASVYENSHLQQRVNAFVSDNCFQTLQLLLSELPAKSFRTLLIFPKHYHW